MAGQWAGLASNPAAIGLVVLIIAVAAVFIARVALRKTPDSAELERERRLTIHREGKLGDGEVIEVQTALITYSYNVAGMEYTASQDTSDLESALPANVMNMIGPVRIKFDPRNPANSIVLCEEWSGLG